MINEKHMNHTNFNRHKNMNSETISEILNITADLLFYKNAYELSNLISGLLDGFLYEEVPSLVEKLEVKEKYADKDWINVEKMKSDIIRIWNECSKYPQGVTKIH